MSDSDSDTELQPGQQADEEWEEWDGDEEEDDATRSLFDDTLLPTPEAAFAHDAQHHGFDIRQYKAQHRLDDYEVIRVINFIRRRVAAGADPRPDLLAAGSSSAGAAVPWAGDEFLAPVLPEDPLLTYDYDETPPVLAAAAAAAGDGDGSRLPAAGTSSGGDAGLAQLAAQVQRLSAENTELKLRVAALMDAALPADVRQELRAAAAEDTAAAAAGGGSSSSSARQPPPGEAGSSSAAPAAAAPEAAASALAASRRAAVAGAAGAANVDAAYFDSYSTFDIHHEMLSDKPRTLAYHLAINGNPGLIRGATVLDIGCGTAILSMFAARAGAAAVVGLDGSAAIASAARQIVAANGLDAASGGPVTIVTGRVEQAPDIGRDKVDVIVSEWMGYGLLFESMLDSLLAARDRWLAPGGALLPDLATITAAGADSRALADTAFWLDVYGFTMAPVAAELAAAAAREPKVLVRPVPPAALTTEHALLQSLDLATMAPADQDFTTSFELRPAAPAAAASGSGSSEEGGVAEVAALVLWFDVEFSARFCKEAPVSLSTAPKAETTHWAQAVLPLAAPVLLPPGAALSCRLSMARSRSRHRALDMSLEYSCAAAGVGRTTRVFTMEVTGST